MQIEKKMKHSFDAYSENDKYLSNMEESKLENVDSFDSAQDTESFLQTEKPKVKKHKKSEEVHSSGLKIKLDTASNKKILVQDPKYFKFENCIKKTGYLNLVKDMSKLPGEITVTPIYVSMSLSSVNLFLSPTDEKTLFNTIPLKNILRISQQRLLEDHHCFELILAEVGHSTELSKTNISLCANSRENMKSWIDTIGAFKECQINVHNVDHNRMVVADFQKVNELIKGSTQPGAKIATNVNAEKSLYYDNNPTINKSAVKVQKDSAIKREMSKIFTFMKEGNIQQTQLQRKMANQLKEAKKFSEQVHQKQEIIRRILEKREEKEKEKEQNMVKVEEKSKELELLRAVENRIMQMKKQEIKTFSSTFEKQITQERQHANNESKQMMRTLVQEEKFTPYDDCTAPQLLFFEDTLYVDNLCQRFYGEHQKDECQKKGSFCNMCCAHHVGKKYPHKVNDCNKKCSGLLNGINWKFESKGKKEHQTPKK